MSSALGAAGTRSPLVRRFQHLSAVPSFHCDGVFGRAVHELFAAAPPQVVALELPAEMQPELAWAATCWPAPVVSIATTRGPGAATTTLPFVAGDSILEAFRLATAASIPVAFVDRNVVASARERAARADQLPGAELAGRTGLEYVALAEAVMAQRPAGPSALAREAVMARHLAALMERYASVLWVGGLAHWSRIEARLRSGDFSTPAVPTAPPLKWRRGRLAASALHHMTGQSPWKVQRFAASPQTFDPLALVLGLLHEAGPEGIVRVGSVPEPCSAVDRARVGVYARNLAATDGLREEPQLSELVVAARNVVGPRYAARVYHLGMSEQTTAKSSALDPLTFEVHPKREAAGYRFRTRWITVEPWQPADYAVIALPEDVEVDRSALDKTYAGLKPARPGEKFYWGAYPPDQAEYEAFVDYVLRRASLTDPGETRIVPFSTGLADGIDVRATIRHWHDDRLFVREEQRGRLNIRNGVIDWTSDDEQSAVLQRRPSGGWNDPDSSYVGSASREFGYKVLEHLGEGQVTLRTREWSAVTLDSPTYLRRPAGRQTFFDTVISELLKIQGERRSDNLYGWLEAGAPRREVLLGRLPS